MGEKPARKNAEMSARERGNGGRGGRSTPDAAFDLWLQRGLHAIYDDVASEPVPEELLRLIQEDRRK